MVWLKRAEKLGKVLIGVSAVTAALIAVYLKNRGINEQVAHTSRTTNFEPSVKWDSNWDNRDPVSLTKPPKENLNEKQQKKYKNTLKKNTPSASRHLIFIRHGNYNLDGVTDSMRRLTKLGKDQAKLTGLRLKNLKFPYINLVSSTMTRAVETADIIQSYLAKGITVKRCDLLREGAPIPPEPPIGSWRPERQFVQDGARIEAAFRKYFHRADPDQETDSYEVIVCHANVIRYFVCRALQFPPEAWLRISLYHGSMTFMTVLPSGEVILRTLGDAGFLPPEMISAM